MIKNITYSIRQSEILRSIFTLSSGSVLAQIIPIIMSVILARLYTPKDFGDWGIFSSIVTILTVIACGRYEYAILRPRRYVDALNIVCLSLILSLSFCTLLFVILFISDFLQIRVISDLTGKYWIPVYVLMSAGLQIFSNYANRFERYKVIAYYSIIKSTTQALTRTLLGILKVSNGLIIGAVIGVTGGVYYTFYKFKIINALKRSYSFTRIKELAEEYKGFPFFELPGGLLNALSTNLPLILLAVFFSKDIVGFFSMAIYLLYIPIVFLGNAMGQVFYKKACTWKDERQVANLAFKMLKLNFILGIFPILLLVFFNDQVFVLSLGTQWGSCGNYALLLTLWIWAVFCFSPLNFIFFSKDKQKITFYIYLILFILRVITVLVGGLLDSILFTVFVYGLVGLILTCVQGYYAISLCGISLHKCINIKSMSVIALVALLWCNKTWTILF